ncbi:unnamed protein product, partial [Brugia pahangi]|uniref:Uncharacterized protein n=1 Tax=Brugia pahangi TaxID=6280 RepID=A0A0N4THR4_BRUPA
MLYPMEIDAIEDREENVEDEIDAKDKSNLMIKTLSLITMISLVTRQ